MSANINKAVVAVTGLLLAGSAAVAAERPLIRWVDAQGQVHYGDKVPAADAKQGREKLNKNGTVAKVVPRELSGVELEQAQARIAAEKAAAEARQQRVLYDRYLLQSFASVADLQATREERTTSLDARLALAKTAVSENEKILTDLRARPGAKKANDPVQKQIQTFEGALIDNLQAVRKLTDERAATATKYTADIERFKALRAGVIKQGDPLPTACN